MRPLLWVLCSATALAAAEFRFDSAAKWSTWKMPYGLIEFGDRGQLRLVEFRKGIKRRSRRAQLHPPHSRTRCQRAGRDLGSR